MSDQQYLPLAPLLTQLGIMLTLSLMVERFIAGFNWVISRLFVIKSSLEWQGAEEKREQLHLAKRAKAEEDLLMQADSAADPREIEPHPDSPGKEYRFDVKLFEPAGAYKVLKEFWLQILATFVAVVGCYYMQFSIWTFVRWAQEMQSLAEIEAYWWEFIFTGIIIGAGSKPVNFLMNFLINRKIEVSREQVTEEARKPPASDSRKPGQPEKAVPAPGESGQPRRSIEELVGFIYDGGDRPERLEHTHHFTKPVDMIVYHHTAMNSESPFEEVIKEFDRKGWLTGYNCVVMKDGAIHVLCRWDRFGNHAKGYNGHSLGIALHGNFEPNPKVPFSNPDGRFGIMRPTVAQVDSAARVVAFWAVLHNVKLAFPTKDDPEFPKGIVPHYELAPKACPGGNFPHDEFEQRVRDYVASWKENADFQLALNDFKAMPMVMA